MMIRVCLGFVGLCAWVGCDRSTSPPLPAASAAIPASSAAPNHSSSVVETVEIPDAGLDAQDDGSVAAVDDSATSKEPCPSGMALLPAGTYKLGKSGRRVTVESFCIDKREITVAEYAQCVRDKGCSPRCIEENRCTAVPVDTEWGDEEEDKKASRRCNGGIPGREQHPVNCVSYEEAVAYCKAQNKRLPHEEEWEWAIRGGPKAMRYPWGILDAHAEELCWAKPHKDRTFKRSNTCAVGSHPLDTTPEGVQDMAGNVSEWVVGTSGGRTYPTLRGASFWAVDDGYVKGAMWGFDSPAKRSEIFGVRCAQDVRAPEKTHSSDVAR